MPTAFYVCKRLLFLPIFCPYGTLKKRHGNTKGVAGHGRNWKAFWPFRVRLFHHCASVPPRLWARHDYTGIRTPLGIGGRWSLWADVVPPGKSGRTIRAFIGVQSNNYWSSTTYSNNTTNAWNVNLNDGNVNNDNKTNTNYVWPVRAGEWWSHRPDFLNL